MKAVIVVPSLEDESENEMDESQFSTWDGLPLYRLEPLRREPSPQFADCRPIVVRLLKEGQQVNDLLYSVTIRQVTRVPAHALELLQDLSRASFYMGGR